MSGVPSDWEWAGIKGGWGTPGFQIPSHEGIHAWGIDCVLSHKLIKTNMNFFYCTCMYIVQLKFMYKKNQCKLQLTNSLCCYNVYLYSVLKSVGACISYTS